MNTPLFPSDEIHRRVRQVLERVPAYRPRATLQAYNAFLQRWLVVRLQGSENIFYPELLALLLLIQYVWPDIFHRISTNPYYFFYLHALATGRDNHFCTQSEMAEIKDLGLPLYIREKNIYPYDDPNLFRLLEIWDFKNILPANIDPPGTLSILWSHITLDPTLQNQSIYPEKREEIWATLVSGDPARIKLLQFYLSELLTQDYEQPLLESVLDLNKELERTGNETDQFFMDAEVRVFALGLIGNKEETAKVLMELLSSSPGLRTNIKLRIVYAIERLMQKMEKNKRDNMISKLVQGVLINDRTSKDPEQRIRVKIAKLAHYGTFASPDVKKIVKLLFSASDENELVKIALIEGLKNASWREQALMSLTPKIAGKMALTDILKICESGIWPATLGDYFLQQAQLPDEFSTRVFAVITKFPNREDGIQNADDKLTIIKWLSQLLMTSEEFRKSSWSHIVLLQSDPIVSWSIQTWTALKNYSLKIDDPSIVHVLNEIKIKRFEARDLLQSIRQEAPIHWQNIIEDALADEE